MQNNTLRRMKRIGWVKFLFIEKADIKKGRLEKHPDVLLTENFIHKQHKT